MRYIPKAWFPVVIRNLGQCLKCSLARRNPKITHTEYKNEENFVVERANVKSLYLNKRTIASVSEINREINTVAKT